MHPQKFLAVGVKAAPAISDEQKANILAELGGKLVEMRAEDVEARKTSGIEDVWLAAEEAYIGIDDANRAEFANAKWAKPTSMTGGLTMAVTADREGKSTAFVLLTARYVDHASAKLSEIILPIDDKAFSIKPKAVPDKMPLGVIQQAMGMPAASPAPVAAMPQPPQSAQPIQMPGQPGAQPQQPQQPPTDADYAQKAEDRIQAWLQGAKYPREARKVIKDSARLGVGVLKGPFPDVRRSKAMTTNGQNVRGMVLREKIEPGAKWIDPWNFYPAKGCGENINDGDHCWEKDTISERKLKALKKQEKQGYLPDAIDQVVQEGPGKRYLDASASNKSDKQTEDLYELWHFTGLISREELSVMGAAGMDTLADDLNDIPVIVTMVNDTPIRAALNPLDSGSLCYRTLPWSRRPGSWAGKGVAEQLSMPQKAVNAATRSMFNNAGLSAGMQFVIDQLGIEPADGKWTITPNKIWYGTGQGASQNVRELFNAIEIPSVQQQLLSIIEYGMKLAEESTNIPLAAQGQTGPEAPDTIGAAELNTNNSHAWMRSIGEDYDDCITAPLVDDYYEWLLLDPNVPDEEKGEFTIDAQGSAAMVERAIQEQVMLGLIQASANPAFNLDPSKLMDEYLKAKRLNPARVKLTDAQIAARNAQPPVQPVQVQVQALKNHGQLQNTAAEAHARLMELAAEQSHDQQALQTGGMSPHMATAMARVRTAEINAQSRAASDATRAQAELAYVQTERDIAAQNAMAKHQERQDQMQLAILKFAEENKINLTELRAKLADRSMQEQTTRQIAQAQIVMQQNEAHADRAVDLHKHHNPAPTGELPVTAE